MACDTATWRAKIGTYRHPHSWRGVNVPGPYNDGGKTDFYTDMCWRLFACMVVMNSVFSWGRLLARTLPSAVEPAMIWLAAPYQAYNDGFNTTGTVSNCPYMTVYQPFVPTLLLQAADIETNPGPDNDDIIRSIETLGKKLSAEIQGLSSNIKKLQSDFTKLAIRQGNSERECTAIRKDQKKLIDEVGELKTQRRNDAENIGKLIKKCDTLTESVEKLDEECDRLEGFSRRDNVRFFNIDETDMENCKQKVLNVLRENVDDKDWNDRDIIRAHRLGRSNGANSSRPLIAKFAHWEDKMLILNSRDALRDSGIKVASDLTKRQRETLKRTSKETGKRCYYKGQKLVIPDDDPRDQDEHSNPDQNAARPMKRPRERTPTS